MPDPLEVTEVAPIDIWGIKPDANASLLPVDEKAPEDEPVEVPEPKGTQGDKGKAPEKAAPKAPEKGEEVDPVTGESEEETDDFGKFFTEVETITGENIQGDFDSTAAGIASYITAAKTKAVNDTFNRIQAQDPRAYAYLVHRVNGGSDTDFFAATGNANLPTLEQVRANPGVQESVLRNYYYSRGLGERESSLLIKAAIDDEQLAGSAEQILSQQMGEEAGRSSKYLAEQQATQAQTDQAIAQTAQYITSVVTKGDLNGWSIPKQEHNGFMDYLDERFDYIGGKPYLKIELSDENLAGELQSQYLAYKKGNLTDLVKRQANTQNAQRLKLKAAQSTTASKGPNPEGTGERTLSSIW